MRLRMGSRILAVGRMKLGSGGCCADAATYDLMDEKKRAQAEYLVISATTQECCRAASG